MSFKSEAFLKSEFGIDESVLRISNMAEKEIEKLFKSIKSVRESTS